MTKVPSSECQIPMRWKEPSCPSVALPCSRPATTCSEPNVETLAVKSSSSSTLPRVTKHRTSSRLKTKAARAAASFTSAKDRVIWKLMTMNCGPYTAKETPRLMNCRRPAVKTSPSTLCPATLKPLKFPFNPSTIRRWALPITCFFFTHLGFWLSDQSTVETRVGFFKGSDKASQTDGIYTFADCIVDQYSKIRQLLSNRFGFAYEIAPYRLNRDGTRNEVKDYPENAVREALINMFAHRDYSREGLQAFASSFSDHLEFLSCNAPVRVATYSEQE